VTRRNISLAPGERCRETDGPRVTDLLCWVLIGFVRAWRITARFRFSGITLTQPKQTQAHRENK
jgi:hypothetical protein